jgi:hypothetical protein
MDAKFVFLRDCFVDLIDTPQGSFFFSSDDFFPLSASTSDDSPPPGKLNVYLWATLIKY